MLEQLKYINHVNEVFRFGSSGIFVNTNELHDYEWKVASVGNRISSISREVSTRKLPVVIMCDSEEEGIQARNRLLEIVEKDVLAMQHGKIIIGNYYFRCFVTSSRKTNYLTSKKLMELDLILTSDFPVWVKESTTSFKPANQPMLLALDDETSHGLDFPYDFNYDYFNSIAATSLNNPGFVPSNFKIIIYGGCSNPIINIQGHVYQVDCEINPGEYLTIDSTAKTIKLTKGDGSQENHFNDRNKTSYIFEKIPVGVSSVTWDGNFGFDVILLEERSEPKWI